MNTDELRVMLQLSNIPNYVDNKYLYITGNDYNERVFLHKLLNDNKIKYNYVYIERYHYGGYKIKLNNKILLYIKKYIVLIKEKIYG